MCDKCEVLAENRQKITVTTIKLRERRRESALYFVVTHGKQPFDDTLCPADALNQELLTG